jgi:DUF4097 and DUF4098 domain-containing protein YvlB
MKRIATNPILFLFLVTSVTALAVTEEKLDRRFSVQPSGTVVVDVDFGSINVSTNVTSEVVVEVWRKIGRRKKADEEAFLRENPVAFTQEGNTVTIRSRGKTRSSRTWSGRNQNDAKYTISVPAQFEARLKTGGGGIDVVDLTGEVQADTGGGGLSFARLHGPLLGQTGGGSVKARACDGKLTLRTGGGGIEAVSSSGALEGTTGGGGITVKDFQGPARVSTGGGGLTIEKVEGAVDASTGGGSINAVLPSEVAEPVKLSTGGGNISVSIPVTAAFDLDAKTHGGSVSSELPVTVVGKVEEGRLQGPVNGGGKSVQLTSGGGSIRIKKL